MLVIMCILIVILLAYHLFNFILKVCIKFMKYQISNNIKYNRFRKNEPGVLQ